MTGLQASIQQHPQNSQHRPPTGFWHPQIFTEKFFSEIFSIIYVFGTFLVVWPRSEAKYIVLSPAGHF